MSIHSRRIANSKISHVISVKVTGGVEWLPFPLLDKSAEPNVVDYLAISGDFESLSIIIHGCEALEGYSVAELPLPPYFDELSMPFLERNYTLADTDSAAIESVFSTPLDFALHDELNQPLTDVIERNFATYLDLRISSWYGKLMLPADKIDVLVDSIDELKYCLESDLRQVNNKIKVLV
eukprot:CAMPEP_0170056870 /NCGR_PEP_ID=MMETSP0019_2-20121128/103_1 /TAXON_ID=98059 /ORGANISM="Dinobryon sp., Strain UTEXLB2267" /LENGTH=179 /DNA_ID=CAMNT_0010261463 /DNA_START=349 /DNA_END=885 /DNA_ORIENTATION=-